MREEIALKLKKVQAKGDTDVKEIKDYNALLGEAKAIVDRIRSNPPKVPQEEAKNDDK